jgi:hypothetical protein
MEILPLLTLMSLVALGWFFWDGLRVREIANDAMREACQRHGLMFLDDTVALRSVRPARDDEGRVRLRRIFDFAYSSTGYDRSAGYVVLMGGRVEALDLALERQHLAPQ